MATVPEAFRAARQSGLLPERACVLLAVSGGADSMALLYGAAEVVQETGWRLAVGHVQHGWRQSDAERDLVFVREHARRLGLPLLLRRVDARAETRRLKLSPEAGARHLRYQALAAMARECGAERVATAHQRDDVVESYLIARERRAGLARLGGPRATRRDGVVRPLLEVPRDEIRRFLTERGLTYRRDASNGDLRLLRNRVRRMLAGAAPAKAEELARRAKLWREIRDRVDREFEERIVPTLRRGRLETVADAKLLQTSPADLSRRALEEAALPFAPPGRPPMTGREREQILLRLQSGVDFRFEAGRRIRFERRGAALRVRPVQP